MTKKIFSILIIFNSAISYAQTSESTDDWVRFPSRKAVTQTPIKPKEDLPKSDSATREVQIPLIQESKINAKSEVNIPSVKSREINTTLLVTDPTVSDNYNEVTQGFYIDYWSIKKNNKTICEDGTCSKANFKFKQPGIDYFVTKGDFSLGIALKGGSGIINLTDNAGISLNTNGKGSSSEISLRYLMSNLELGNHFFPYLKFILGKSQMEGVLDKNSTIFSNLKLIENPKLNERYSYHTFGLGAIMPINEKFGFRGEFAKGRNKGSGEFTYRNESVNLGDESVKLNWSRITSYYNFDNSINFQLGVEKRAGDNGVYLMIGKIFQ